MSMDYKPPAMGVSLRAFTLIELLVATALALFLMSLAITMWDQTRKAVERTRAILAMDVKTRQIIDKALDALDNRSGCLPLCAQNDSWGWMWDYNLRTWHSNQHYDPTTNNTTAETYDIGGGKIYPKYWTRHKAPEWNFWRTITPSPDLFDVAAGKQILTGTVGLKGEEWGTGEVVMWHGIVRRTTGENGMQWMRGDATAVLPGTVSKPFTYYPKLFVMGQNWIGDSRGGQNMGSIGTGSSRGGTGDNSISPSFPERRYVSNLQTDGQKGPFRDITVVPYRLSDKDISWLGTTHLMRVVNGPSFEGHPWLNGLHIRTSTGLRGSSSTTGDNEPDWFEGSTSWMTVPSGSDPGASIRPRPRYGALIEEDNAPTGVGARWRVEAPILGYYTALGAKDMSYNADVNNQANTHHGPLLPDTCAIRGAIPIGTLGTGLGRSAHHGLTANVSKFVFRTSRTDVPAVAVAPGRFVNLTNNSWWDQRAGWPNQPSVYTGGANYPGIGMTAGYVGNHPTGSGQPGHPVWTSLTIGLVGGFKDDPRNSAIERRWTITTTLR